MGNKIKTKVLFITPDGLSTLIFAKSFNRDLDPSKFDLIVASSSDNYKDEISKIKLNHVEIKNFSRFFNIIQDIKYIIELFFLIKKIKPDTIITFTTKPNIYVPFIGKLFKVKKIIIAIRGLGRMFDFEKIKNNNIGYLIFKLLYRFSIKFAEHVWFTNIFDRDLFINNKICDYKKVILTKNAIDVEDFSLKSVDRNIHRKLLLEYKQNPHDKVILMVARLIKEKGIFDFAEAAKILKNEKPNFKFLLVAPMEEGGVDYRDIIKYEKTANFKWLGYQKNIRELYSICDLSVLPSYYSEGGYPRALLEAMSFSKPAITTNLPLCRGAIDDNKTGFLIEPRNPKDLSKKILKVFENNDTHKKLCKNSREKILKEFDDKIVVSKILSYIS